MTENDVVGWHHQLNGQEFEPSVGDSEGPGSLVCCSPWGHKEPDTTEQLNNKEQQIHCIQETHSKNKDTDGLKVNGW